MGPLLERNSTEAPLAAAPTAPRDIVALLAEDRRLSRGAPNERGSAATSSLGAVKVWGFYGRREKIVRFVEEKTYVKFGCSGRRQDKDSAALMDPAKR